MTRGPTTPEQLWALAVRSGLAAATAVRPPATTRADLAERLVEAGRLTRFQAEKLLAGRWQGLVSGGRLVAGGPWVELSGQRPVTIG
ncbi:MAG: hypothetical protein ABGY75_00405 [Gemmataceae bacterium]